MSSPEMPRLEVDVRLALRHFELSVQLSSSERVLGIHGRSGAGKSSLLKILSGLERRARGYIRFGGETWLDSERRVQLPPEKRRLGYVPQGALLFPHLSVMKNLRFGASRARAAGVDLPRLERQVIDVLELAPLLAARPVTLSGGERQRVAVGRALLSGARLLLLDEPTASLGAAFRRRLLPLLERVPEQLGVPMVLVSHEPLDHLRLAGELLVLEEGRVVDQGEPPAVLQRWLDPEVCPLPSGRWRDVPALVGDLHRKDNESGDGTA